VTPSSRLSLTVYVLALACGGGSQDGTGTTGTGSTMSSGGVSETGAGGPTGATTGDGPTGATTTTGAPTSSTAGDTSGSMTSFIVAFDMPDDPGDCDTYAQDCPEGQKCAPWAEGGGSAWNATKCVPVTGDQLPGETCMAEGGGVSGLDDCIKGAMCWDVDARNQGVCVAHCIGTRQMRACAEPDFVCPVYAEGVLNICIPGCDPLAQDCPEDELCLATSGTYLCVLDASGDAGAVFDACEFANACAKGLLCLGPQAAAECDQGATGCCLPLCSIADGGAACPGAGQECLPVYMPQPEGFEDVGHCTVMV
jgi:hypothetical protein